MKRREKRKRRAGSYKSDGPTSRLSGDCAVDDCPRPRFRSVLGRDLCSAHVKKWQRAKKRGLSDAEAIAEVLEPIAEGSPLGEDVSPEEQVIRAGSDLVETSAENDQLYEYRRRVFLRSVERWMISRGWRKG